MGRRNELSKNSLHHVEFEQDQQQTESQLQLQLQLQDNDIINNDLINHKRSGSLFSSSAAPFSKQLAADYNGNQAGAEAWQLTGKDICDVDESRTAKQQQQRKYSSPAKTGSSSRGRIAGYLATKLSNLTNLAGGSNNNSSGGATGISQSSSAPPSPLYKRASNSAHTTSQQLAQTRKRSNQSAGGQVDRSLFYLPNKDYGGCDFILILECPSLSSVSASHLGGSSSGAAASSGLLGSSQGGAGGQSASKGQGDYLHSGNPLVIHLVAPNLEEKAAWMSDISQVS